MPSYPNTNFNFCPLRNPVKLPKPSCFLSLIPQKSKRQSGFQPSRKIDAPTGIHACTQSQDLTVAVKFAYQRVRPQRWKLCFTGTTQRFQRERPEKEKTNTT
ncbi:uncharacterized protein G2W53_014533 [Senna tora]|uniref:Uncharacterized protein n=1 Tax=Senna tora TaxID=362788 RepID=A0A835C5U1_9FABA|nr:uncharacterized protein G2W53_014533 [Senna tora]